MGLFNFFKSDESKKPSILNFYQTTTLELKMEDHQPLTIKVLIEELE